MSMSMYEHEYEIMSQGGRYNAEVKGVYSIVAWMEGPSVDRMSTPKDHVYRGSFKNHPSSTVASFIVSCEQWLSTTCIRRATGMSAKNRPSLCGVDGRVCRKGKYTSMGFVYM